MEAQIALPSWTLCTSLTDTVFSVSARARVDPEAGRTRVDELVAILQGKYGDKKGWKYAAQSRELLGIYDSLHSFENDAAEQVRFELLRRSARVDSLTRPGAC